MKLRFLLLKSLGKIRKTIHILYLGSILKWDKGLTSTVRRRSGESRIGGKTNLVVGDNMDSAMSGVFRQFRQMESFEHNTLTAERGITVEQD